jgi:hypothetical protein
VTDLTESKVRQWALKRNGDPIETHDVIELVLAVDDDGNARHSATMDELASLAERLRGVEQMQADHWEWTQREPLPRLKAIEERQEEWENGVAGRQAAIHAEHLIFHNAHLAEDHAPHRSDDDDEEDWTERRRHHNDVIVEGPAPPLGPPFTVVIVVIILMALAVAATLEYVDKENAAGRVLLILMPIVTLGGWWISSRKK